MSPTMTARARASFAEASGAPPDPSTPSWTVTADGKKFLLNAALATTQAAPFTVVLNWPETLSSK